MTDKHIPASKLLALLEYYDAEMQCLTVRSDDLRAIIDEAPEVENQDIGGKAVIKNHPEGWEYGEEPAGDPYTGEPVAVLALKNTELSKRVSVLEDLLSSAYNIANREGKDTHWFRFAAQLHVNGISPVTAKTFKILPSDNDKPPSPDLTKLIGELVEALENHREYICDVVGVARNIVSAAGNPKAFEYDHIGYINQLDALLTRAKEYLK